MPNKALIIRADCAEQHDELASLHLHTPPRAKTALEDNELATISQRA
jgi:hypothetical protein